MPPHGPGLQEPETWEDAPTYSEAACLGVALYRSDPSTGSSAGELRFTVGSSTAANLHALET